VLPKTLSEALRHGVSRGALSAVVLTGGFFVVLWLDPWLGGLGDRVMRAVQLGVPIGFFALALTPFPELWTTQGRSTFGGLALSYLCALVGILLGVTQAAYATRLGMTYSPGEALEGVYAVFSRRIPPGAVELIVTLPFGYVATWAIRVGLHRRPGRARWAIAAFLGLCCAGAAGLSQFPAWMPVFLLAAMPLLIYSGCYASDRLMARLRGETGDEPPADESPLAPLDRIDAAALGGRGFLWASLGWFGVAALIFKLTGSWQTGLWGLAFWFLHLVLTSNYAALLIARRQFERAVTVSRHRLADPWLKAPAQRRNDTHTLVRALCGLGRLEAARERLPQALTSDEEPGFTEQVRRYNLAHAFSQAGDGETCLQLLDTATNWKGRILPMERILRAVALDMLDRPEEAQALLEGTDVKALGPKGQAVLDNNLAVFELHKDEPDTAKALAWARSAYEVYGKLPPIRGSYGAALLASGADPHEALPHLEASMPAVETYPPQGQAYAWKCLGDGLAAVSRTDEAREAYGKSSAAANCKAARQAARALAALNGEPLPPETEAADPASAERPDD
jgi:hypothetical protein